MVQLNVAHPRSEALIVIVEDEPDILFVVQTILEKMGNCLVKTAVTGKDGLRLVHECQPDLILLDYGLPDMSGEHILGQLQQDSSTADIPVLMMTGNKDISQCLALGARDIFYKPFDISKLRDKAQEVLSETQRQAETS